MKYEDAKHLFRKNKQYLFFDLAVPRDISSAFHNIEQITLFNVDHLGGATGTKTDNAALQKVLSIIAKEEEELESWEQFYNFVAVVKKLHKLR